MYVDKGVEPSVGKVNLCEVLVGVAGGRRDAAAHHNCCWGLLSEAGK